MGEENAIGPQRAIWSISPGLYALKSMCSS